MHTNYERKVSLKDVASETPFNSPSFGHSPIMLLTPFVREICLSICWPSGHDTVVLFQAGSSLKLCRNKTVSTFMARSDLVLRTELCRLSNRHCGEKKMPPDNQVLFISSALSLKACRLWTVQGEAGAPSMSKTVSQRGKWETWKWK